MNKEILERFFTNEASKAEVERILAWFEAQELDPQKSQTLEELWQQIDESDYVPHEGDRILENIHRDIERSEAGYIAGKRLYRKASHRQYHHISIWAKAAAILVVAVGFFVFWTTNNSQTDRAIGKHNQVTKIAKPGEKKMLTLSDGTMIHLNAGSRLTFPEKFSGKEREVFLSGEAFFEVREDLNRRFVVHTGALTTTVLGTSFNIKSYDGDERTDVSLANGKLKVESQDSGSGIKSYILNPGEAATLDKNNNILKKTSFDPKLDLGWTKGILVFQDAGMKEMITRLERWYGITIEVENPEEAANQEWKYRGVFKDEPLENVLKGISYVKDFSYTIENKKASLVF